MTELERLPTTDSGHVKKKRAMRWLNGLSEPTDEQLKRSIVPKPSDFSGSKYAEDISDIRITGTPEFIETVAARLKPLQELENSDTRVEINLQQTEDRDTGELTDNYALYISVAERG